MTGSGGTRKDTRRERIERREAKAVSLGIELHAAAQAGNAAQIGVLLKHGASVSARLPNGWTPIQTATHHGRAAAIEALLAAGADPVAPPDRPAAATPCADADRQQHMPGRTERRIA